MSAISITKLYDLLTVKLGRETAENLTNFIENKINQDLEDKSQTLATKEDLVEIKENLAEVKGDLKAKISDSKREVIKWMVVLWLSLLIAFFFRK
jgi:hypothetical protein